MTVLAWRSGRIRNDRIRNEDIRDNLEAAPIKEKIELKTLKMVLAICIGEQNR